MVESYFTNRVFKYDTKSGWKDYDITGGGPCFSRYETPLVRWLLKIALPKEVKLVAYIDDVAVVMVAKHLKEIILDFDTTFG